MIVLTADHGGYALTHLDPTNELAYTIPLFIWGPGFSPGIDLYRLFANRADPFTNRVDFNAVWQPLRNGDAGNLALAAMGLPQIPGSTLIPLFPSDEAMLTSYGAGENFNVEWSAAAVAFQLESASSPGIGADWMAVTNGITTNVNTLRYSTPANSGARSSGCAAFLSRFHAVELGIARASRAVFRAFAEQRKGNQPSAFSGQTKPPADRRGRRSEHARARVLPENNGIVPHSQGITCRCAVHSSPKVSGSLASRAVQGF